MLYRVRNYWTHYIRNCKKHSHRPQACTLMHAGGRQQAAWPSKVPEIQVLKALSSAPHQCVPRSWVLHSHRDGQVSSVVTTWWKVSSVSLSGREGGKMGYCNMVENKVSNSVPHSIWGGRKQNPFVAAWDLTVPCPLAHYRNRAYIYITHYLNKVFF